MNVERISRRGTAVFALSLVVAPVAVGQTVPREKVLYSVHIQWLVSGVLSKADDKETIRIEYERVDIPIAPSEGYYLLVLLSDSGRPDRLVRVEVKEFGHGYVVMKAGPVGFDAIEEGPRNLQIVRPEVGWTIPGGGSGPPRRTIPYTAEMKALPEVIYAAPKESSPGRRNAALREARARVGWIARALRPYAEIQGASPPAVFAGYLVAAGGETLLKPAGVRTRKRWGPLRIYKEGDHHLFFEQGAVAAASPNR